MNFAEALKARLEEKGLTSNSAEEIMKVVVADTVTFPKMQGHWFDDSEEYSEELITYFITRIRPIVYKWTCEHLPLAWWRVDFSPGIVGLEGEARTAYIDKYLKDFQGIQARPS